MPPHKTYVGNTLMLILSVVTSNIYYKPSLPLKNNAKCVHFNGVSNCIQLICIRVLCDSSMTYEMAYLYNEYVIDCVSSLC